MSGHQAASASLKRGRRSGSRSRSAGTGSIAVGDERQHQKPRAQRATWACERCRNKKLRCTGGYPCSSCQRAEIECDFDDRGTSSNQGPFVTNQRLLQLEKTVTDLVAGLSHLTSRQQPSHHVQHSAHLQSSSVPPSDGGFIVSSPGWTDANQLVPRQELTPNVGDIPDSSSTLRYNMAPTLTNASQPGVNLFAPSQAISPISQRTPVSPIRPEGPEGLQSRWTALQQNEAPFPQLMAHPIAWSGKPAKLTSEGGPTEQSAIGMTQFTASVNFHSDPMSERIVTEPQALALFRLFFHKCHPSFPLLEPGHDLGSYFANMRSSSPFLFTVILMIAGRYYPKYREFEFSKASLPEITIGHIEAINDLAISHLGFVLVRKQHQLSDVQAAILFAVWIPRGDGKSPDQWMITGLCTRLAYRIELPDSGNHPLITRFLESSQVGPEDIQNANNIVNQWHTWLIIHLHDTFLSLGFGRPHTTASPSTYPQQYLALVRKLGSSSCIVPTSAAHVASLAELSLIATDLISGLQEARLPPKPSSNFNQPVCIVSGLLSALNQRIDEWQLQWTWRGSYGAISLGNFAKLTQIYGEHTRLCLNTLSLNLLAVRTPDQDHQRDVAIPCLTRACEATVAIVQLYTEGSDIDLIIRFGTDYLILILGQAAVFLIRLLAVRTKLPLPFDPLVLVHYFQKAVELLESNDVSKTGICGWVARLSRDLARHAGILFDAEPGQTSVNSSVPDFGPTDLNWDFDISALIGQELLVEESGLDLVQYLSFSQPFIPPS